MVLSNSKPLLLQTQNHISPLLMIFIISLVLLDNVSSQSLFSPSPSPSPSPEKVNFGFSSFLPQDYASIALQGHASIAGGSLQLTKKDNLGNPTQNSIGRAQYRKPVHLWDKTTGNLADFSTAFTFAVNPKNPPLNADGFAFFLAPVYSTIPTNSTGGYLGLFSPQTALDNTSWWNQIVAIEFDTYVNEWDPTSTENDNHIGIDVNSIRSALSAPWPELDNGVASASINYNSEDKTLSVFVTSKVYPNRTTLISHVVDLRTVLPEWVHVGFSAATGLLVETHDILTWSFEAAL